MSSLFDKTNHFTDCRIDFPSVTFCGNIFNDILKQGLSINQFEDKYKRLSKSQIDLRKPNYQSSIQYNLQTDLWGPKEFVTVHRQGTDYQVGIVFGIRNTAEFNTVANFLAKQDRVELIQDQPGMRMFEVGVPYTTYERTREVLFAVQRYTEQATMVTLLLNF